MTVRLKVVWCLPRWQSGAFLGHGGQPEKFRRFKENPALSVPEKRRPGVGRKSKGNPCVTPSSRSLPHRAQIGVPLTVPGVLRG